MALATGSRLGPYEILAGIGAGGMGEVYRARDSKLGRDVALKVLPEAFARDAERMARFQREAKVLASLNHPNIASIYGLEDSGATHALVMELVEGPTLADRIRSGPIPIDEALRIAKQITEALEYAHERGIVHRDLKPANVKVTNDDAVKVLDFGLAKAIEGDAASIDISTSPTISRMATLAGVLLGTAAYMSPEQAKGKAVDRRADIWAFGCVLYEMLTGKQTFTGETVTDTLAAVIRAEPDWLQLPAATPVRARVLLQRCLQKDPKQRLRDIGDARISLEEVLSGAPDAALGGSPQIVVPWWRRSLPWAVAAVLAIALGVLAWVQHPWANNAPAGIPDVVRFQLAQDAKLPAGGPFAVSPDGRQLAFTVVGPDGASRLWIRALDSLEARLVPNSETAVVGPFFWSPDSRYIAFGNGPKLKKIDVADGGNEALCDVPGVIALGGSWNRDGVIIFGQANGPIMRVSANGGSASPLTIRDPSRGEIAHAFPSFFPDGRHFVYSRYSEKSEGSALYIGSLDAKPEAQSSKPLLAADSGGIYVPSSDSDLGQLLFVRGGALLTQSFDARRLELVGEPVTVTDRVGMFRNYGLFSASANRTLVLRSDAGGGNYQLTWLDQQGKTLGTAGESSSQFLSVSVSPDGARVVASRFDQVPVLWLTDLSRGTSTRFTFGSSYTVGGAWSPDGSQIIFTSYRDGQYNLYRKRANGLKDEELLLRASSDRKLPTDWSRDGRFLIYDVLSSQTKGDIWVLPLDGNKKPFVFLGTEFYEQDGRFSPDGHLIAYASNESGRDEIYVRTFSPDAPGGASDAGGKWLISTGGGTEPRWRRDGKELYYVAADGKLMAVDVATAAGFQAGAPKALFPVPATREGALGQSWDVAPDGKRFLFPVPVSGQDNTPFTVVLNWQAGLKK
jgi:serine/threonine protein kinase/Tol biopolymer transport system component